MKYLNDIKTWVLAIIFFVGIGVAFAGWAKLPAKVEKVEAKVEETENNVQKLAGDIGKYIEVQAVKDEQKEKSAKEEKELLYKWIEQVSKK